MNSSNNENLISLIEKKTNTLYNQRYLKVETIGGGSFGKIKKVLDTQKSTGEKEEFFVIKIFYLDNVNSISKLVDS